MITAMLPRTPTVSRTSLAVSPKCTITLAKPMEANSHQLPRSSGTEREVAGVDLGTAVEEQREDNQEDHPQHGPQAGTGVGAVEAALAVEACRAALRTVEREVRQREDHEGAEEVLEEAQPRVVTDERDGEVALEDRAPGLHHGEGQDDEAPEGEEVGDAGHAPLQQLALTEDLDELGPGALADAVEAAGCGRTGLDHPEEEERPAAGDRERSYREEQPDDQAYSHETSQFTQLR